MKKHIKLILFTSFILSSKFSYGQCSKTKQMLEFIKNSKAYNAVFFTVKKTIITINSFNLKTDIDTTYTYEKYWCIREKNKVKYLKENSDNVFMLSYNDTFVVSFTNNFGLKHDQKYVKQSEFEAAIYFLGKNSDSFYCNNNDSIKNTNDYSFKMLSSFESEVGPGLVELEFTFDKNGMLIRKESFYNIEFAVPKIYTIFEYDNFKYYKKIPREFADKIKAKHKQAIDLIMSPKKHFKDTNKYSKIDPPNNTFNFKPVYKNGSFVNLDSTLRNNKLTLVYFWFQGCVPCAKIKPEIDSIFSKYKSFGLQVIGLNDVDNEAIVDSTKTGYINFHDENRNVRLFKEGYPQIIVFNSKGEMIGQLFGYSKSGIIQLKKHISELLN